MLEKHYRLKMLSFEKRWIFVFLVIIVSILTSYVPVSASGESLPSLHPVSIKTPSATYIAKERKILSRLEQVKQIEVGQERVRVTRAKSEPKKEPAQISEVGKATQIDEHTWTMQLKNDEKQGSAGEIFHALNSYRTKSGKGSLIWNDTLSSYAQSRANDFSRSGTLDGHAGFVRFMNQEDGFSKMGFNGLGENSSYGYTLSGTRLIETVYSADAPHNDNQLNSEWTHVGIGVSGVATNLIFGGKKR